ncbi:hypothetical protein B0H12DRAFT_1138109 [Mycena haematopus]|nr:hypothetical protein B0H12DRAFT_1138109 [Mycena haematopus]
MQNDSLKIPEILQEIALFVENSQTLSSLARVDRFTHAAVMPCLFHSIQIRLNRIHSLALALRNKPERASSCRSLSLGGRTHKSGPLQDSVRQTLYTDLITIFGAISARGVLATLRWRSREVRLSEEVWTAISSALGSLQELDMCIVSSEEKGWRALTSTRFTQLRVLRLDLSAHGWDCAHLQSLLDTLGHLEQLSLQFPMCCGPRGITLGSTHPHLKRFSFTSYAVGPESDFLARHPGLESLFLNTEQPFSGTHASSPKMLRALNVDPYSLWYSPALIDFPITHLRLREIGEYLDDFVFDAVRALGRTLRYLELDVQDSRNSAIPHYVITLCQSVHALDELAINRLDGPSPLPPTWASDLLTDVLTVVGSTPLRALRFRCPQALPQERLLDLGPLPPQLRYIGWDLGFPPDILDFPSEAEFPSSLVYMIEKRDDKNVVAKTLTKSQTADWMTERVLHFMGESWSP